MRRLLIAVCCVLVAGSASGCGDAPTAATRSDASKRPAAVAAGQYDGFVTINNNSPSDVRLEVSGTNPEQWLGTRPDQPTPAGFQDAGLGVNTWTGATLGAYGPGRDSVWTLAFKDPLSGKTLAKVDLENWFEEPTEFSLSNCGWQLRGQPKNDCGHGEHTVEQNGHTITVQRVGATFGSSTTTIWFR